MNGSIHIDLNSGKVLYTIAHELLHFIRDWSPKHFKQMADIVMAGYSRENVPLDKLIADQQALAKEHGRELTEDEAFEEVIANALEGVMADGKVAEFLRAIEGKDKSLGAKVRQFFQDIAKLIQDTLDAYAGVKPDSVEGKMTMQLEDVYRQLQQVFAEGVHQSGENFRRAEKNTTGEGGVRYSFGVTQDAINEYINAAYEKENTKDIVKYAEVSARLVSEVSEELDITGYAHALRDNDIRHIRNSHGENTNEKYPVTKSDLAKIPDIVENYDKVFVKTNSRGKPGIVYVKVGESDVVYYVEAVTTEYHNEKLLVNKQMIKTGIDEIPNLHGLIAAINKKESSSQYLADLQKIRKAYVQDVKENYSTSKISHSGTAVKPNSTTDSDGVKRSTQQKENATVADMLKKENEKLKADVERLNELLKLQRTITGGTKFTESSVEAAARVLKKNAGATGNTAELASLLNSFYEYIATSKELTWEDVREQAKTVTRWLQDHVKHRRSEYAQEVLDQIHGSQIYLDESQKKEAAYRFL